MDTAVSTLDLPGMVKLATPATSLHDELSRMDAYWRAANYLSVGQIYLYDNPLLREPLKQAHIKPLVVGHWGTTPGQNFIYVHLNRVIKKFDLDMFYIAGPGHGGPALVANTYLEGSYSEVYPDISQDEAGMKKLFTQFSFPGGISSHVAPTTPGSIHEGGELGYSLSHAFGAAFDNPGLIVACIIGDGEAETGPAGHRLAVEQAAQPDLRRRGAADPAPQRFQDQQPDDPLPHRARGAGAVPARLRLDPLLREGDDPATMHKLMAETVERAVGEIREIQHTPALREHALPPALADDRAALAERVDRAEGAGRAEDRGHVPRAPGADPGRPRAPRPRGPAREPGCAATGRRSCSTNKAG